MPSRVMKLGDFRQYLRKLRRTLAGADGAVVRGIHSGVMRSISVVHFSTDHAFPASPNGASGAVNTGAYKQAWQFELRQTGGRIYNLRPYAAVIERGRRRGRRVPPIREIELWARRRLGLSGKELDRAKFAIAKAISKRGLVGRRVLTNPATTDKITRVVMDEVRSEVRAALRRGGYP